MDDLFDPVLGPALRKSYAGMANGPVSRMVAVAEHDLCSECDGYGYIEDDDGEEEDACSVCDGIGWVE